jgi:Phage Tail Collar Domain
MTTPANFKEWTQGVENRLQRQTFRQTGRAEVLASGTIMLYAGLPYPAGWLPCDGSMLDPAEYPDLFAVLGVAYGGDGTTTFGVPNIPGVSAVPYLIKY